MGTHYALGVVKEFEAQSSQTIGKDYWKKYLNERIDLNQYTVTFNDNKVEGKLKEEVFEVNIEDFYNKLVQITNDEDLSYYLEISGVNMNQYPDWATEITIQNDPDITLSVKIAILFIEGKVLAEQFTTEPLLINWLFKHVDLTNPLSGCILSDIVG